MKRIGVLALQGAFVEHIASLERIGVEAMPVRLPGQLDGVEGLILPGGESTTIGKLMVIYGFDKCLGGLVLEGMPVYGTCAGMILLAREVEGTNQPLLGLMNLAVKRNAFGRQVDSFELNLAIPVLGEQPFHAVFIRAPAVRSFGPEVCVLATLPGGEAVAARQGNMLVTAFHPELTSDTRVHEYFVRMT
ncbi:MAG: pyridoxal 5'-phosphate synthase glutaminase subunit PdxT [Chloroflexi bacterium]|nr:pyridoxal 5'-phosphate synthase glutaminase subunit PdxT [Chloroflexota bacterium]